MGLNVRFTVAVIAIIIVGFSASAYIFSSQAFDGLAGSINMAVIDKSQYIEKIDNCLEIQTIGDVTLNSFTQKWAFDFKEKIMEAESNEELENIMNEFYTIISHCKP